MTRARDTNGVRALRGYSVVDGGDVVRITQRGGAMVRMPASTVIGDNLDVPLTRVGRYPTVGHLAPF